MLDLLLKTVGGVETAGPLLLAGAAWFGGHYLFAGPEIGARLGALEHLPRCVAGLEAGDLQRLVEHEVRTSRILANRDRLMAEARARADAARREAERLEQTLDLLIDETPMGELLGAVDPDGALRDGLGTLMPSVPELPELSLPPIPEPPVLPTDASRESRCGCAVDTALRETRTGWALYSATLTGWRDGIAGFDSRVARLVERGACAKAE